MGNMGNTLTSCGSINKPIKKGVRITQVENGYLVNQDWGNETLIANTLPEAMELARKIME
jgi:hypothetical protein